METKFRPVPVTILDFLGILLPGFVWLILLATTFEVISSQDDNRAVSPITTWEKMTSFVKGSDTWFAPFSLVVISLLIGYLIKPWAMVVGGALSKYLFKIGRYRKFPVKQMKFPYPAIHGDKVYYKEVSKLLKERLGCAPEELFGSATFAVAKRYLRLTAPTLWEESERMEAEVRMSGAMFLAALYSVVLSGSVLIFQYDFLQAPDRKATWLWLALSVVAALVLGQSVNMLRVREVGYTYTNALVALNFVPLKGQKGHAAGGDEED